MAYVFLEEMRRKKSLEKEMAGVRGASHPPCSGRSNAAKDETCRTGGGGEETSHPTALVFPQPAVSTGETPER